MLIRSRFGILLVAGTLALTFGRASAQRWVPVGPAPMTISNAQKAVSGRVSAIAVDPRNNNHWLIGGAQGGVWESSDGGKTFWPKTDSLPSLAMGAIAFAPSAPDTVYAGTGEANFWSFAYGGMGLLKSVDNGLTWTMLAQPVFQGNAFSAIQVHPKSADTLLAAITTGNFGRQTGPPYYLPNAQPGGVFKSVNGGVSWTRTLGAQSADTTLAIDATDLKAQPGTFANMYAALGDQQQNANNGLFRSQDAGSSWSRVAGPWDSIIAPTKLGNLIGRIALAFAPGAPNTLYVGIQTAYYPNQIVTDSQPKGVLLGLWRTDSAFSARPAWRKIFTNYPAGVDYGERAAITGYCGTQCSYNNVLSVDPANPNTLYAAGLGLWRCTPCNGQATLANWKNITQENVHVDFHALAWMTGSGGAANRLIVGNDGGVWSTTRPTSIGAWQNHNATLALTQFYYGSAAPNDSTVIGGAEDNGTSMTSNAGGNGGAVWTTIGGSDGSDNAISHQNSSHQLLSTQGMFAILRTTDGWKTSTAALNRRNPKTKGAAINYAPIALCPSKEDYVLVGSNIMLKTTNFFSGLPPDSVHWLPNLTADTARQPTAVAFAASDTTCNTYAFATKRGQVWLTTSGGGAASAWRQIGGSNMPGRYATALAFDPTTSGTLYVTYSGFDENTLKTPGHVFKTTTALGSVPAWTNITPPTDFPHNTIAVDPTNPSNVYVGTDFTVYRSTNGGAAWTQLGSAYGLPNVAVYDIEISPAGTVYAFTFGRSAWMLQNH